MVGPYKVIATNGSVVRIEDESGSQDYVHRAHVCPAKERSEKYDIFENVALPVPTIKTAEKPSLNPLIGSFYDNCVLPDVDISAPTENPVQQGVPDTSNETGLVNLSGLTFRALVARLTRSFAFS